MNTRCAALIALAALTASVPHSHVRAGAVGTIETGSFTFFPGSRVAITAIGLPEPYTVYAVGDARVFKSVVTIPSNSPPTRVTVVAANRTGMAAHLIHIGAPPSPGHSFIAVASYDNGIVVHRAQTPFRALGVLGIGGAATDVAIDPRGRMAAADTDGEYLTLATLQPWHVRSIDGVVQSDEIAADSVTHAIFATNRDVNGAGALTRVLNGTPQYVTTGETAEGIAIDERRQLVYVANVNSGSIAIVDARTLRILAHFHATSRAFSLALSTDGTRLYVVANQSLQAQFDDPGRVIAFDVRGAHPKQIARSAPLAFPVGIAYDGRDGRVFVTDEQVNVVYSLDARTLRATRAPVSTCTTPWLPTYDRTDGRLYIPCARSNAVDVRSARTLRRLAGAPFATGGYPLAVAIWHPGSARVH